ncbi:MAG: hypothetical protein ACO1N2_00470 [Candidatus Saccharimonadota bacterium]
MNPQSPYPPIDPNGSVQSPAPVPPAPSAGYTPLQPAHIPTISRRPSKKWLILTFVFVFTTLASLGVSVWAYINYVDQRDNVDSKVSVAVADAVKEQADKDAAAFLEKEKQPNRQFAGPDDYGRLSFDYPKTWSIYVAKDASTTESYEAYFNPVAVPAVAAAQQYALRVTIENKDYDKVLDGYSALVKKGDLKSTAAVADEQNGTRLDGNFTKDIRGSAVIFKIRDKTVTLRTDAQTFTADFDALIKTITFNK